ncbi:MAG: carbohydrate kinase family protein, partial [Myxococcota bacterium]
STFGYAQLGYKTGFVGYVGDDPWGDWIRRSLSNAEVQSLLMIDPAGTSRSINLMRSDGTRRNFYDGKSHMTLTPDVDAITKFLQHARLLHVHLPNWARHLLPAARRAGVRIACDLQDMTTLDDPYRHDFIDAADFLFCSAANFDDPRPVADALLTRNPRATVVVGLGADGALLVDRNEARHFGPVDHPDPVIDTNGAGDSLAVGFLTARVFEGRSLEAAVHCGQVAARHTCTLRGTMALITRSALHERTSNLM